MEWLEVSVTIDPKLQEIVSQILLEQHVQGLEVVDPEAFRQVLRENRYLDYSDDGFIDCYGEQVVIKAYFNTDYDITCLKNKLAEEFQRYSITPVPQYEIRRRDDSEWKDSWKKHYKTFSISNRVVIKPSWDVYTPTDNQVVVKLEPGMAFGTGAHETTKMCANFLDDILKGNERVLDLGCGTGILGIIAAKLGAGAVVCVDVDDTACKTAEDNARKNHVREVVHIINGELKDVKTQKYDIIVVNIIADVILSLLPGLKEYCNTNTTILLSGIINERRQDIVEAAEKQGYRIIQEKNEGEWVAMQICTGF